MESLPESRLVAKDPWHVSTPWFMGFKRRTKQLKWKEQPSGCLWGGSEHPSEHPLAMLGLKPLVYLFCAMVHPCFRVFPGRLQEFWPITPHPGFSEGPCRSRALINGVTNDLCRASAHHPETTAASTRKRSDFFGKQLHCTMICIKAGTMLIRPFVS